jgi:hypothetical protein
MGICNITHTVTEKINSEAMAAIRFDLLQFNGSLLDLLAIGSRKVRPSEVMRRKLVGMSRLLRLMRANVLLVESSISY